MKIIILLFVLCLINVLNGFNLQSSTIVEKQTNVLGAELNYALMDLEFDREIYRYQSVACPNIECTIPVNDCSCDYTGKGDQCGITRGTSCPACPKEININPSEPEYPIFLYYCSADEDWTSIEANKKYTFNSTNEKLVQLRYKANSGICEGLRVFLNQNQGSVTMNVSPFPYFEQLGRFSPSSDTAYTYQINICPSDNQPYALSQSWTSDTYFINILPQTLYSEFTIEIMSVEIPSAEIPSTCDEVLVGHECVIDGSFVTGYGLNEQMHYYTYSVTEPRVVAFSFPSLEQDIDFFISDDPSKTKPDSFSKAKWDCSNERDDYLTLKLEPLPNGDPLVLYIGVSTFYESNFGFTITSQGTNKLVKITDDSPKSGAYSLTSSSRLKMESGDSYSCNTWSRCDPFSIQFPFTQNLPIWPVPPTYLFDRRFFGLVFEDSNNPPQPNHYKAAFLLSSKRGNEKTVNSELSIVMKSQIEFLSSLVDIDGNPLKGSFGFTLKNLTCDYQGFLNVTERLNQEEDTLFSTTDFVKLNSVVFKINTLTLTDEWVSCSNQANSLLSTNITMKEKMTTFCPYASTDIKFSDDPCCNSSLSFFHCCVPRLLSVEESDFIGVRDDLVDVQCSSPECTESVLTEYQQSLSTTSDCEVPGFVLEESQLEMRQVLRQCKAAISATSCDSNSDCSAGVTCDLFSRFCLTPPEAQDKAYLKCVFENLPKTYIFSITYKHNLTGLPDSSDFIENVFNTFKSEDCSYITGQSYRTHYQYYSYYIEPNRCYPSPQCLDLSCETVHDVCYDGNYGGWVTEKSTYKDVCETDIGFCNRKQCDSTFDTQQCQDDCESVPNFCGYCSSNFTDCFAFNGISQATCPQTKACLLPDGVYDTSPSMTAESCESSGFCDKPCGYKCSGPAPACYITKLNSIRPSPAQCQAISGGSWDSANSLCKYTGTGSDSQSCKTHSTSTNTYTYVNCSTSSFTQCYSEGLFNNICSVQEIPCTTKEQCENTGGECSDTYFFSEDIVNYYPESYGKCVRGHYIWKSHWPIPTCDIYLEKDSPLGCYPYYFTIQNAIDDGLSPVNFTLTDAPLSEQECLAQGNEFHWWTPSSGQTQCLSTQGCRVLDKNQYNLPYNFRFNEMTEEQCGSCGSDVIASWENMFTWSPGTWHPGVYVNASWIESKYIFSSKLQELLDYQFLYEELDDSVNIHIADLYRSESLCRMERIEDNLKSISCSCSGGGNSEECFTASALVLGESKPCQGEESSYSFNNGIIYFTGESVVFSCTSALISQISRQLYKSTVLQSLSSSFVSYRKPDSYGVLNSKDAIIGTILSDGIKISSQGLQSLTLCFVETDTFTEESKTYPVLDFAYEDLLTGLLTPLEIQLYSKLVSTDNQTQNEIKYICGDVQVTQSSLSLLPIHRFEEWEDVNKEVFDKTARGLLYTLAVFFLLTSIWGFYQIGVVIFRKYTLGERIKLVHLLIVFVTLFITIRAIYFFILPSGSLSNNPVGDYILVVLPTFIYFTSFTIIIVLWYIIVKTKQTGRYMVERLTYFIVIINVILYLLFMIIVLVFHYSESDHKDDCGGRIIVAVSNTTPQRVVSIFYAVIQAVISLVIGAAFIYLGGTLYLAMRFKKTSVDTSTSASSAIQQQKIFIITFACSIGFILHCVFVLILVGAEPSNVVFSFLGLIITEILPSLSIFYAYNQGNLAGIKQTTLSVNLKYVTNDSETFSDSNRKV